jgi:curli biogenesis system outer membrane secretion channel CsgG
MRKLLVSVFCVCMFIQLAHGQAKPRIAVMDFDYATVRTASQAIFGTEVDIGKGITDLLVEQLVNGGTFSVIERKALETIMNEQDISNSNRFDSSSAASIGRLLGVDAIVTGSITQFGNDDSHGSGAGAIANQALGGLFGVKRKTGRAVVGITTRIVNVDTGEVLTVVTGRGESRRTSTSIDGLFANSSGGSAGAVDMGSSNFRETIIGEAITSAVDSVASQLHERSGSVTARAVKIAGRVIDVEGNELTLDVGRRTGVKVGDILKVERITREITDDYGMVIRRVGTQIGDVVITEVGEQYSVGGYNGSSPAEAGDRVSN